MSNADHKLQTFDDCVRQLKSTKESIRRALTSIRRMNFGTSGLLSAKPSDLHLAVHKECDAISRLLDEEGGLDINSLVEAVQKAANEARARQEEAETEIQELRSSVEAELKQAREKSQSLSAQVEAEIKTLRAKAEADLKQANEKAQSRQRDAEAEIQAIKAKADADLKASQSTLATVKSDIEKKTAEYVKLERAITKANDDNRRAVEESKRQVSLAAAELERVKEETQNVRKVVDVFQRDGDNMVVKAPIKRRRIWVIGRTGCGKTTTIGGLMDDMKIVRADEQDPLPDTMEIGEHHLSYAADGKIFDYTIMDTRGADDALQYKLTDLFKDICRHRYEESAIVLVLHWRSRLTRTDMQLLQSLIKEFGSNFTVLWTENQFGHREYKGKDPVQFLRDRVSFQGTISNIDWLMGDREWTQSRRWELIKMLAEAPLVNVRNLSGRALAQPFIERMEDLGLHFMSKRGVSDCLILIFSMVLALWWAGPDSAPANAGVAVTNAVGLPSGTAPYLVFGTGTVSCVLVWILVNWLCSCLR